jgi:hypothetical protein
MKKSKIEELLNQDICDLMGLMGKKYKQKSRATVPF